MAPDLWFPASEPDSWRAVNAIWVDIPAHARLIMEGFEAWSEFNTFHNPRYLNPYLLPNVQAFAIIKTMPNCFPWLKEKCDYYQELSRYTPNFRYRGDYLEIEGIDKFDINWGMPVDKLIDNIDSIDQFYREEGVIVTFEEWAEKLRSRKGTEAYGKIVQERERKESSERFIRREIRKCWEAAMTCLCHDLDGAGHTPDEGESDLESVGSNSI